MSCGTTRRRQGKDQQVVRQQFVTTGEARGDQVSILKGLSADDVVVTAGQLKLHNGSVGEDRQRGAADRQSGARAAGSLRP